MPVIRWLLLSIERSLLLSWTRWFCFVAISWIPRRVPEFVLCCEAVCRLTCSMFVVCRKWGLSGSWLAAVWLSLICAGWSGWSVCLSVWFARWLGARGAGRRWLGWLFWGVATEILALTISSKTAIPPMAFRSCFAGLGLKKGDIKISGSHVTCHMSQVARPASRRAT
jgi:hypothetical protein